MVFHNSKLGMTKLDCQYNADLRNCQKEDEVLAAFRRVRDDIAQQAAALLSDIAVA
jgi:hypothetical protein